MAIPVSIDFLILLAKHVRETLLPHFGKATGKVVRGVAQSGDTTFQLDVLAEDAVAQYLHQSGRPLAYYTEDRGLVKLHSRPQAVLIIDPIDGTRPAACGFESAVVSIALCPYSEGATFKDIFSGAILELKSGELAWTERGRGTSIHTALGTKLNAQPSQKTTLEDLFWSYETVGRPARWVNRYLADLIDRSSMNAAVFVFNSAAYSITRLVTGQLDAHIDLAARILKDHPEAREEFLLAGRGRLVTTFAYDIAAAYIIAREAGCTVTDGYGQPLDEVPLLEKPQENPLSCLAAANPTLHETILKFLEAHLSA